MKGYLEKQIKIPWREAGLTRYLPRGAARSAEGNGAALAPLAVTPQVVGGMSQVGSCMKSFLGMKFTTQHIIC
jgi:hypothetical protein